MGVRTRGVDIKAGAARLKAYRAARIEAELVVDRWNRRLATGRDMLWWPTIRAALIAGTPWLDVFCPAWGTSRAINLRAGGSPPAGLASGGGWFICYRATLCPRGVARFLHTRRSASPAYERQLERIRSARLTVPNGNAS
jgi:hypothetical protein